MTDVFDKAKRSAVMSRIRGKNTIPERSVRSLLYRLGYRFRLHCRELPGNPDIVLPGRRTVIFVNGCFWHRHARCRYATTPATRRDFWKRKFFANVERDKRNQARLRRSRWRVLVIWECQILKPETLAARIVRFLGPASTLGTRN